MGSVLDGNALGVGVVSASVMGVCGHLHGRRGVGRTFWGLWWFEVVVVRNLYESCWLNTAEDANRANTPRIFI